MKKIIIALISMFLLISNIEAKEIEVKFKTCIDGDTAIFLYNNEKIKTRFLAIDTPETEYSSKGEQPLGKEASDYTCNKLKSAKEIVLEYDDKSDETDKYDRHLVWVWLDSKLLQKDLVSKGYAKVTYLYNDYKYTDELIKEETKAKEKKIGIWSNNNNSNNNSNNTEEKKDLDIKKLPWPVAIIFIILSMIFKKKRK